MDHDADMIRIVEGRRAALKGGIIEVPFRRSELPDELGKVVPVFLVASPTAFGGKVILVPPLQLRLGGNGTLPACWLPIRYPLTETRALQRSGKSAAMMSAVRAPQSKPARIALSILKRIHQSDDIDGDHRLLAIAEGVTGKKARRAIAAQIGDDHPVACLASKGATST